jgi:uncharacterized protein
MRRLFADFAAFAHSVAPHALPIFVALAAFIVAAPAGAQNAIPQNDGWVTDLAGFLTPSEEQALETLMESYKIGSTHEIALLTVPSLEGRSPERFALEVARAWKMGTREKNNAALLVVSREDRKIRIEVGRGLEGNLTDSISGRIIRDVIVPEMQAGRYYEGLRGGIEAMHAAAGGEYGKIPVRSRSRSRGMDILGFLPFLFLFFLLGARRRRGGILPWLLLGTMLSGGRRSSAGFFGGSGGFGGGGGGFGGFGGGGGFSGGGASGGW